MSAQVMLITSKLIFDKSIEGGVTAAFLFETGCPRFRKPGKSLAVPQHFQECVRPVSALFVDNPPSV